LYNIAFTGIVIVAITRLVDLDPTSQSVLQVIGVLWGSLFCSIAFVIPRLFEAEREKKLQERQPASSSTSFTNTQNKHALALEFHHHINHLHRKQNSNAEADVLSLTSDTIEKGFPCEQDKICEESCRSIELSSNSDSITQVDEVSDEKIIEDDSTIYFERIQSASSDTSLCREAYIDHETSGKCRSISIKT
jgi:hypothetical protein